MNPSERIEVPKTLDESQIQFFVEKGYLAVPDLVSPAEIEALKADMLKIARGGYPSEFLKPLPPGLSDQDVLESLLCIHLPLHFSPVVLAHIKHPRICGALSQTAGAHLANWDGSVKCMQSMLFVKPPGFQGQAWHQDELYIPTRDRSLIGAWTAIDDATVDNGCLWVIPGSHKNGYLYPQRIHDNPDEFDFAPESYGFDESLEIPVEVKSGSVVFF
ncbi:phytanoyl-CoA dioxygenase family protein [Kamptonema cortianum]|nr:phytanoyl-CoA dioxygenase family protein [Kamptonema cortianum]